MILPLLSIAVKIIVICPRWNLTGVAPSFYCKRPHTFPLYSEDKPNLHLRCYAVFQTSRFWLWFQTLINVLHLITFM